MNISSKTENSGLQPPAAARRRLAEILEKFEISLASFDSLRPDSYEKDLAAQSLDALERFYLRLLDPAATCDVIQPNCLPWSKASQQPGQLPTARTLQNIRARIIWERQQADADLKLARMRALGQQITGLPLAEQTAILNGWLVMMNRELMGTLQEDKPTDLKTLDRLIHAVTARARVDQGERRVELASKTVDLRDRELTFKHEELQLEHEKFEWFKAGQPVTPPVIESPLPAPGVDRTDEAVDKVFGKDPYESQN